MPCKLINLTSPSPLSAWLLLALAQCKAGNIQGTSNLKIYPLPNYAKYFSMNISGFPRYSQLGVIGTLK